MLANYRLRHPGSSLVSLVVYDSFRTLFMIILKVVYRLRVRGISNIPKTGAVLMVANHQSFVDPPMIGSPINHRHTDFLARGGLFKFKPFGWVITLLHSTPIKQGSGDAGAMKATIAKLNEGKMMLVFPEGSRTDSGEVQEFQRGIALLLKRVQCQVIPVGIAGAYDVWPRTRKFPKLFTRPMSVVYGQPIDSKELMTQGADHAMNELRTRVIELVDQAEELRS